MTTRTAAEIAAHNLRRCQPGAGSERRRRERELVLLFQRDPDTRHTVVEAFRPLAQSVAKRYHRGEEPLEDLVQVAMLGLLKALRRFDPERGTPFATYALPTIMGEVRRHYRDTGWAVHVTRTSQELAQRVMKADRDATDRLSAEACAARTGMTVEQVVEGRLAARAMRTDSLDRSVQTGDGELPVVLAVEEDAGYAAAEHRATITQLTDGLPERERSVLALRFSRDLSQAEIGRRIGVSQMHVSRILRKTLADIAPGQAVPDDADDNGSAALSAG